MKVSSGRESMSLWEATEEEQKGGGRGGLQSDSKERSVQMADLPRKCHKAEKGVFRKRE